MKTPPNSQAASVEVCILAGGLSSRMGTDKSKLKVGGRTLLAHIRKTARELGYPVRVIRHDLVPRSGPVGGIYTALQTSRSSTIVFLSCDMPFVPVALMERLVAQMSTSARKTRGIFVASAGKRAGFPFVLSAACIKTVEQVLNQEKPSLQLLASRVKARKLTLKEIDSRFLFNVNTPVDWQEARRLWKVIRNKNC